MQYYFIDTNIWCNGEKQEPRKVRIKIVKELSNDKVLAYDDDYNDYTLDKDEIFKEF